MCGADIMGDLVGCAFGFVHIQHEIFSQTQVVIVLHQIGFYLARRTHVISKFD